MKIFFDTEFTGLFPHAKLISIGFVCESSPSQFYGQLYGHYKVEECSEFCRATVIPLLEPGKSMPIQKLREDLRTWLTSHGDKVTLLCDAPTDIAQFAQLFPQGIKGVHCEQLGLFFNIKRKIIKDKVYQNNNLRYHHSLDDAIANKLIKQKSIFS